MTVDTSAVELVATVDEVAPTSSAETVTVVISLDEEDDVGVESTATAEIVEVTVTTGVEEDDIAELAVTSAAETEGARALVRAASVEVVVEVGVMSAAETEDIKVVAVTVVVIVDVVVTTVTGEDPGMSSAFATSTAFGVNKSVTFWALLVLSPSLSPKTAALEVVSSDVEGPSSCPRYCIGRTFPVLTL